MLNKEERILPQEYQAPIAIPPGETILELLEELDMTQKELSQRLDCSQKHLTYVIKGKAEIRRELAKKLELVFDIDMDFWLNLENDYRKALDKLEPDNVTDTEITIARNLKCYKELANQGYVELCREAKYKVYNLRRFFGVTNLNNIAMVNAAYRKANLKNTNDYALAAWIRIAEIQSNMRETKEFKKDNLKKIIPELRNLTRIEEDFFSKLVETCAEVGIALTVAEHLSETGGNGVSFLTSNGKKAVIQLSVRGKNADKFWFTLFHEICHLLYDNNKTSFVESDEETEERMDKLAKDLIISKKQYEDLLKINYHNLNEIKKYSKKIGIHYCMVIGRLKFDKIIPYTYFTKEIPKFQIN